MSGKPHSLRALTASRFGHALLDAAEAHGGVTAYMAALGSTLARSTFKTWVLNARIPSRAWADRLVEVSPELRAHLEERGCFARRPRAAVPRAAGPQTREQAAAQHDVALAAARDRAKHLQRASDRLTLIRQAAKRVNRRARAVRKQRAQSERDASRLHHRPGNRNYTETYLSDIAAGGASVALRDTLTMETE